MNKYTLDYVKFFIFRNGIGHFPDEDEIKDRTYNNPRIKEIIQNLQNWPGISLKTHKSADHPLHKLAFLAELGFTRHDPGISDIVDKIFQLQSKEGPFQIRLNIPVHFGGSGDDQLSWMLCDATVLVYALISLNGDFTPSIRQAIQYMTNLMNDNGWPCAAARESALGSSPGRRCVH